MHLAMAHCSRDLAFIEEIAAHLHHLAIAFTTNTSANSATRKARHHVANNPPLRFGLAAPSISKLSTVSARSNANMMTLMTSASARQSSACTNAVYIMCSQDTLSSHEICWANPIRESRPLASPRSGQGCYTNTKRCGFKGLQQSKNGMP